MHPRGHTYTGWSHAPGDTATLPAPPSALTDLCWAHRAAVGFGTQPAAEHGSQLCIQSCPNPPRFHRVSRLVQTGRLSDKIKNFCENHLYSHPAPELDSLYPSSAEGHSLPSSICKGSAGSAASLLRGAAAVTPASVIQGQEAAALILLLPVQKLGGTFPFPPI